MFAAAALELSVALNPINSNPKPYGLNLQGKSFKRGYLRVCRGSENYYLIEGFGRLRIPRSSRSNI